MDNLAGWCPRHGPLVSAQVSGEGECNVHIDKYGRLCCYPATGRGVDKVLAVLREHERAWDYAMRKDGVATLTRELNEWKARAEYSPEHFRNEVDARIQAERACLVAEEELLKAQAQLVTAEAACGDLRAALNIHHTNSLRDYEVQVEGVSLNLGTEYADSWIYERTVAALSEKSGQGWLSPVQASRLLRRVGQLERLCKKVLSAIDRAADANPGDDDDPWMGAVGMVKRAVYRVIEKALKE